MSERGFTHESTRNESQEWYTPASIFEALQIRFDLDPCGPAGGVPWVPAALTLSKADDGLAHPWRGNVWLNPPYGTDTPRWLERLAEHGEGVALVFARTDNEWFHRWVAKATLVCFVRKRIRFVPAAARPAGLFDEAETTIGEAGPPAAAGSMLVAYGQLNAYRVLRSGLGTCVQVVR